MKGGMHNRMQNYLWDCAFHRLTQIQVGSVASLPVLWASPHRVLRWEVIGGDAMTSSRHRQLLLACELQLGAAISLLCLGFCSIWATAELRTKWSWGCLLHVLKSLACENRNKHNQRRLRPSKGDTHWVSFLCHFWPWLSPSAFSLKLYCSTCNWTRSGMTATILAGSHMALPSGLGPEADCYWIGCGGVCHLQSEKAALAVETILHFL